MTRAKILLIGNQGSAHDGLREVLEHYDFDVVSAFSVAETLSAIASHRCDILIIDFPTPNAEDSMVAVNAMRHSQPWAMTIVLSVPSDIPKFLPTDPQQPDTTLEKPIAVKHLVGLIRSRMREQQRQ
jgi:DNA-binding NtrC family response regulator